MIHVLRLGHRPGRDARVTMHVCLTARALGADAVHVVERDAFLERGVQDVVSRFGGPFEVRTGVAWRPFLREWKARGPVVHLTMYGEDFGPRLSGLRGQDVLLVVGAEKVPGDLYRLCDLNLAVGNQPHSEVAALALALDRLTAGTWVKRSFGGQVQIAPNPRGKTLINPGRSPEAPTPRRTP